MPIKHKITVGTIAVIFVALAVVFLVLRVGVVIGWENVSGGWWIFALTVLLILIVALLIYRMLISRLGS